VSKLKKLKGSKLSRSTPIVEDAVKIRRFRRTAWDRRQFLRREMRVVRLIPMRAAAQSVPPTGLLVRQSIGYSA
jgi:hypothetical protein